MLFGKKKKVETPPVEDMPPLPTLETLGQENQAHEVHQEMPNITHQLPIINSRLPVNSKPTQPSKSMPFVKNQEPAKAPEEKVDRPAFAPLFIKIDRYRNILNALGQLRTSIVMIRNSFSTLNELEKARFETLKLIEDAVGRVEIKLSALDSELLRPAGHHPEISPEYQDVETVHATVADLKGQIDQLKAEMEQLS
ncbi:MAG: hypothetical protein HY361_03105 [Candidatus Aenigmarchaeota archaeon]|nr:hypothetical protein [Candidatus Aenigmarchaeota archaeon]